MKNTIFLLFALAAVPSFAQTCGRNCSRQQAQPERHVQFEQRHREREPEERPERHSHNVPSARTYNSRPGGVHINPGYFAAHYGHAHGFHCSSNCDLRAFGGERYFNVNGGWFGIIGQIPGNWAFQTDYLYIGIGDDGNYYLYDAQFPDVAVQLTFVQNIGDDQAGADEDQGDEEEDDDNG